MKDWSEIKHGDVVKCGDDTEERLLKHFSAKPIQTIPFTAKDPKEGMTEQQKLDYDIFMYEAAGNIQMANELRLKKIYGPWG